MVECPSFQRHSCSHSGKCVIPGGTTIECRESSSLTLFHGMPSVCSNILYTFPSKAYNKLTLLEYFFVSPCLSCLATEQSRLCKVFWDIPEEDTCCKQTHSHGPNHAQLKPLHKQSSVTRNYYLTRRIFFKTVKILQFIRILWGGQYRDTK